LSDTQVSELRQLYDTTTNANLRLRYQMVLLASQGRSVAEIATVVFRSRDTVERVLKRFLHGGISAIPRRKAPGMVPTVTPEWKAEFLRVIELDPHTVGIRSANWTTGLLATYLAATTQITVTAETVRLFCVPRTTSASPPHLDAQTQSRGTARLRGKRLRVEVILAGAGASPPPPVTELVEVTVQVVKT
jgi:transposase